MSTANQTAPAPVAETADLTAWIRQLYQQPELLGMGHNQQAPDLNLGLGWLYYSLVRVARPRTAVVIGSWRGFAPMVIARACQDNGSGTVEFIDPSLADDFWRDPARVQGWFGKFGLHNIRHHLHTTQDFVATEAYRAIRDVGLLFVDGYHTAEQARFDYEAFRAQLATRALVLFHDSLATRESPIYGEGKHYTMTVRHYMDELKRDPGLQLLDFPWGTGLTVLRRCGGAEDEPLLEGIAGKRKK
jgi:predicted O-methyltransferase YrrM